MATAGVSFLEKQKDYKHAVDRLQQLLGGWCCPSRRGHWWIRLSTNLEHLGRISDSLEIAESALADGSLNPGDRLSLQRRVVRLSKPPRRWKKPSFTAEAQYEPREVCIQGKPLAVVTGIKSRFYGYDGEQCSVEELALQYYASEEGGKFIGVHAEGGIFATLFGLLLWPVLFACVSDVFRTPFQTAPLDLGSDTFYQDRCEAIEAVLKQIEDGEGGKMIEKVWNEHQKTMCRGIQWDRWSLRELQIIIRCIGGRGLAAICRCLCQDYSGGGMPDLLLWNEERCEAKLSEVKGPRDRLSDQQRAWIRAIERANVQVEVLKVLEPEAMAKKNKKR